MADGTNLRERLIGKERRHWGGRVTICFSGVGLVKMYGEVVENSLIDSLHLSNEI